MNTQHHVVLALSAAACLATPALAEDVPAVRDSTYAVVERQTVDDPYADGRRPLTSDQLSTQSTRLIDARRGYRPFPVYEAGRYAGYGYDRRIYRDTFGIIRPSPLALRLRTPATGVSTTYNTWPAPGASAWAPQDVSPRPAEPVVLQPPMRVIVIDERDGRSDPGAVEQARQTQGVDMVVRIHNNKPEPVTERGTAVLIRSDGTVIELR